MGSVVEDSVGPRRFETLLAVLFAASALLLASLGIYGVVSYSVERRQNEIGIRRAFGAQEGRVLRLVMQQELVPVGCGLLAGFVLALAFGRVVRALLFEVGPGDPLVSASALSLLAAVAALSCYIPARRATKVDPMVALRYE
jgi:putative ABC transport system permease protein